MLVTDKPMKTMRQAIGVFFAFFVLYVATSGGHLYSPDEEIMFRVTESLARHGTLAVAPMIDGQGRSFATRRGVDGREYAQYGIGNSLFAVPLYWLGDLACRWVDPHQAERLLGFRTVMYIPESDQPVGHALLRRFVVSFFGSLVGAATCSLLWVFVYRLREKALAANGSEGFGKEGCAEEAGGAPAPARTAWLVTLAYGAGTLALPHARTFFSEPLATFFVLGAFYVLSTNRPTDWRAAFGAGLAFALALFTRLDSAVVAPAVGIYLVLRHLETENASSSCGACLWQTPVKDLLRPLVSARFAGVVLGFCLPIWGFLAGHWLLNWLHFGSPFTSAYADQPEGIQFRTPLLAGLYGYFMSIGKSVWLFSPALVIGLAGWRRFARREPMLGFSLALAVALLVIFHSRWQNWAGGWCWGPRHIFMAHVLTMLPAMGFVEAGQRLRRFVYWLVVTMSFGVQLYGASQNFIDFYILYYRTPETEPNAYALYSQEDLKPLRAIAPINDSIYVPQNSQWYRYAEMWQLGYRDNLWLRLCRRAWNEEPPIR